MFTTGAKLLLGATVASLAGTVAYGVLADGTMGTIGLVSATVALATLAGIVIFTRDANVFADEPDTFDGAAANAARPGASMWPFALGLAVTTMTLGLVTYPAIFILGAILFVAGIAEWILQAWSERASADASHNAEVRSRLAYTAEMPVAAAIGLGIVIYSFSRVMLGVPSKTSTIVAFSIVATIVLIVGAIVGANRSITAPKITALFAVSSVVLIGGGAVSGLNGERDIHEYETTAYFAEKDECGAEKTYADKHASQTVAGKAGSVEVILNPDGRLVHRKPGDEVDRVGAMQLPRSNPNNLLFRNETNEDRRLVIDLAPDYEGSPPRICSMLVEPGGVQWLTVNFAVPSFAPEITEIGGYRFQVPGVDSADLEVVVP